MPYSGTSDQKLPAYVKKLPQNLKAKWVAAFNTAYKKYGEKRAFLIANSIIKKDLQKTKRPFIKRCELTLEINSDRGFIKRSSAGDDYITFVLNSNQPHRDGQAFSEEMLKEWADYINKNPTLVGDIDHMFYDKVLNSSMTDDQVRSALKGKKGIAKMVQAIYEKGKLWVRAIIDKRYKKIIEKARGVSAEAWFSEKEGNLINKGELLGFSFNVNTSPADYQAGIVA